MKRNTGKSCAQARIMSAIVNVAIQVIPLSRERELHDLVDLAIQVIQSAGVKYRVCPFETVMEGEYKSWCT